MPETFDTTTLLVEKPADYSKLNQAYKLVRYVLPYDWFNSFKRKKDAYSTMYIQLREQMKTPYLSQEYDRVQGKIQRVIYALYPHTESSKNTISDIEFDFLPDEENPLKFSEIGFDKIPVHTLIKLLQSAFANYPYFASQGNYYIHSKPEQEGSDWHLCMEIEIKGANSNQDDNSNDRQKQEFIVSGHARYFVKSKTSASELTDNEKRYNAYYKLIHHIEQIIFQQLSPAELPNHKSDLYFHYKSPTNKPHIDYHNQGKTSVDMTCRGYLLHDFMNVFSEWLTKHGIVNKRKEREWLKYPQKVKDKDLKLEQLNTIYLYDVRHNTKNIPIEEYKNQLDSFMPDISWEIIKVLDEANKQPTIVLQDADKADYKSKKPKHKDGKAKKALISDKDPYKKIKKQYGDIPTQFINVNPNVASKFATVEAYLDYKLIELQTLTKKNEWKKTAWGMRFRVSIFQLFLKDIILNPRSVKNNLPLTGLLNNLIEYAYLRKVNHWENGVKLSYRVLLWVENDELVFKRIEDEAGWEILEAICDTFEYDWETVENIMLKDRFKQDWNNKSEKDIAGYDLILMPNMVLRLEELPEKVLYKYDEIQLRLEGRGETRPISEFKLIPHYDILEPKKAKISSEDLELLGLIGEDRRTPYGESEQGSVLFHDQLKAFDEWLEAIGHHRIKLSQLRTEYEDEIAEIFGWQEKEVGKKTNQLLNWYKEIWKLGAGTGNDVIIDKGIFHDKTDFAYRVADGIKLGKQDKAFTIRRFDVLVGNRDEFDIEPFLEAMSVQFVRYNRYTVYPYFFSLLHIYINEVLR